MKPLMLIIFTSLSLGASAFNTTSRLIEKATAIDTAKFTVTYSLKYKFHPDQENYYDDVRIVQIGNQIIKDYSDVINHFDSLATEQIRRGADSYSNVSGMPWPLEIRRPLRGGIANIKYRLEMSDNFVYSDSMPEFKWNLIPDETVSILGYTCNKATCEFAGRKYAAWFTTDIPIPFGPYKFGGLPGMILKIEDSEQQFIWEAVGFDQSKSPIIDYSYQDCADKQCTVSEVEKTLVRYFKSPVSFLIMSMGGDSRKVHLIGKDGKELDNSEAIKQSIPYKPLEIK